MFKHERYFNSKEFAKIFMKRLERKGHDCWKYVFSDTERVKFELNDTYCVVYYN